MPLLECIKINLQNKVNNELKWLQSESLKPEGVAEIQENILPEVFVSCYWKEERMHVTKK